MAKKRLGWYMLGVTGVDSGQLCIVDPCYVDGYWKKEGYKNVSIYQDIKTKKEYSYGEDFKSFDARMIQYHKTPNELIKDGTWKELPNKSVEGFSYNAICSRDDAFKQISFPMGHTGLAVAFSSGYGDGRYEVWGKFNCDGRITEVKIKME